MSSVFYCSSSYLFFIPNRATCYQIYSDHITSFLAFEIFKQGNTPGNEWTERTTQDNFHGVDIKHFCATMVTQRREKLSLSTKKLTREADPEVREA